VELTSGTVARAGLEVGMKLAAQDQQGIM